MLYVPVGFAHGFCVTSEVADVLYMQDAYYAARRRARDPLRRPRDRHRVAAAGRRADRLAARPRGAAAARGRRRAAVRLPLSDAEADGAAAAATAGTPSARSTSSATSSRWPPSSKARSASSTRAATSSGPEAGRALQQREQPLGAEALAAGPARIGDAVGVEDQRLAAGDAGRARRASRPRRRRPAAARPTAIARAPSGATCSGGGWPAQATVSASAPSAARLDPHAHRGAQLAPLGIDGERRVEALRAWRRRRARTSPRCASCSAPAT